VLRRLVGADNCASVPLEVLHQPHATAGLLGKLVNFSNEFGYIASEGEAVLKGISGGDEVHIDPKYREPFEARIDARFMVSTNTPPRIADRSQGLWRRLMVLPFTVQIPFWVQRPFGELLGELCSELPGIFLWAVAGLARLRARGGFQDTKATNEMRESYRLASNPAGAWCEERLAVVAETSIAVSTIYADYREWCLENGYKPLNSSHFSGEVRRWAHKAGLTVPTDLPRRRDSEGRRYRFFNGICTKMAGEG